MIETRRGLLAGRPNLVSVCTALLLFCVPPILLLVIGPLQVNPSDAVSTLPDQLSPIAGPPPQVGLPQTLVRWTLLSAGVFLGFALGVWNLLRLLGKRVEADSTLPAKPRFYLLILLGSVSLAAYGLNFWLPFPLSRYYNLKQISIGLIANRDPLVALGTAVAIVALFLLYGLAYRLCKGRNERRLWTVVLLGALLLALVNFFVAPITSIDLYDYVARGRIASVYQGNPYVHTPEEYSAAPFMEYASWINKTSAYGPLWETVSALLTRLAGDRLGPNLLVYKGLALAGYLLSVLLIAAILRQKSPERALAGTLVFGWNPLILHEVIANGHNDVLMVVFFLGAFWLLSRIELSSSGGAASSVRPWEWVWGGIALLLLGASVLVKFVPGLFLPFFLFYLLAGQRHWGRRIGISLLLLLPLLLLIAAYYLPFWAPEVTNTFTRRIDMFRMTIPSVTKEALHDSIGEKQAREQVLGGFAALFVSAYLWLLLRDSWAMGWAWLPELGERLASRRGIVGKLGRFLAGPRDDQGTRSWDALLRACSSAFFLYLLLGNFWFWPWYLIWPIAMLALTDDQRVVLPLALGSAAGLLSHLGWNFVWYWWGISWDTVYEMDALVVFAMVVPALLIYLAKSITHKLNRVPQEN